MQFIRGAFPEPDQNVSFSAPVANDSLVESFFRVLFVQTDHECLGVSELVRTQPVGAVPIKKESSRIARTGIQILIALDFETDVRPGDGQKDFAGDEFRGFPLNVVFGRSVENGEKGLVHDIPAGIADEVSPLFAPIVLECDMPFLIQSLDCRWERYPVLCDQILAQGLVAQILEECLKGRFVQREDRVLIEGIEIIRFEGREQAFAQSFHRVLFGL